MDSAETIETLYCAFHPKIETTLRCNRCNKPICPNCAIQTPTGYRCPECVRGQQKVFNTAHWWDYITGFVTSAVLSYLGSLIAARIGFFIILLAPIAGSIIAEAARFVVSRRRARRLFLVIAGGAFIGSLPPLLLSALYTFAGGGFTFAILYQLIYTIAVTSGTYYQISGMILKR